MSGDDDIGAARAEEGGGAAAATESDSDDAWGQWTAQASPEAAPTPSASRAPPQQAPWLAGSAAQDPDDDAPLVADDEDAPLVSLRNDEGAPVAFGDATYAAIPGADGRGRYYCGRVLGEDMIPDSDGQCGPLGGPQCPSCQRMQQRKMALAASRRRGAGAGRRQLRRDGQAEARLVAALCAEGLAGQGAGAGAPGAPREGVAEADRREIGRGRAPARRRRPRGAAALGGGRRPERLRPAGRGARRLRVAGPGGGGCPRGGRLGPSGSAGISAAGARGSRGGCRRTVSSAHRGRS